MANHLGPTMQCKLHRKNKASEHKKPEGSEFFTGSSFGLLKNPRGTWNDKALKNVALGLHVGKAASEPTKQVMKLNSRGMGRNAAWSLGLEGAAGEVILRKSECLADMKGMLVHLYGTVQLPRKKYLMVWYWGLFLSLLFVVCKGIKSWWHNHRFEDDDPYLMGCNSISNDLFVDLSFPF